VRASEASGSSLLAGIISQDFGVGPPGRRGTVSLPAARSKNKKGAQSGRAGWVARGAAAPGPSARLPTGLSPGRHGGTVLPPGLADGVHGRRRRWAPVSRSPALGRPHPASKSMRLMELLPNRNMPATAPHIRRDRMGRLARGTPRGLPAARRACPRARLWQTCPTCVVLRPMPHSAGRPLRLSLYIDGSLRSASRDIVPGLFAHRPRSPPNMDAARI